MALSMPERVGPYEILAVIGTGGMGEVYRARDPRLGREVAIKALAPARRDDWAAHQRLLREARAAGQLNHPNIVGVYDILIEGERPFIVTEFVDGTTLRTELERGALPLPRLLDLAVQIADGLAAAHEAGLVHRDIKPENIMITRTGRVKIIDLGLVRPVGETGGSDLDPGTVTAPHHVMGTAGYMSPEQARGSRVDYRSDLFSFGITLYEMATGRPAFRRASTIETLSAILRDPLPPMDGRIPQPLQWIVDRCLAKDPGERYAATADLLRDLQTLRAHLPAIAGGGTGIRRARRFGRGVLTAAGLTVGLGAGFLLAVLMGPAALPDLAAYRFTPFASEAAYEGAPVWSPDGRMIAYVAEVRGVLQVFTRSIDSSTSIQLTDAVADCRNPLWSRDTSRIYYISLARDRESLWSIGREGGTPTLVLENVHVATIAPDNGALVFLRETQIQGGFTMTLWVSSPVGAEPRPYPAEPVRSKLFGYGHLAFSPDGSKVGLWGNPLAESGREDPGQVTHEFWILPWPTGQPRRVLDLLSANPRASAFSWMPDGRRIVFGAETFTGAPGTHLWVADTETDDVRLLTATAGSEYEPAVSPDGTKIAFASQDNQFDVLTVPLDGSAPRPLLATARNEVEPVWSPVGRQYAYATDRTGTPEIWVRSADGVEQSIVTARSFPDGATFAFSQLVFSRDGRRLAYQRRSPSGSRIWVSALAGGPATQPVSEKLYRYQDAPTWSPDGNWLAFTFLKQGRWGLARVRPGSDEPPVVIRDDIIYPSNPRWSPDGRWITCELQSGMAIVSPDGRESMRLDPQSWIAHDWSPGGRRLYAVRQNDDLRLELVSVDVATLRQAIVNPDIGPSPPIAIPLRGFSVAPDGKEALTAIVRLRSDLFLLEGFEPPAGVLQRLAAAWDRWRRPAINFP